MYTWQAGRQLPAMQKTGMAVEYAYDHNGLRTQKTVTTGGYHDYDQLPASRQTRHGADYYGGLLQEIIVVSYVEFNLSNK